MANYNLIKEYSPSTSGRYVRVVKFLVRYLIVLPLLKELSDGHHMHFCIGVTHIHDDSLYGSNDEEILRLTREAYSFEKKNKRALRSTPPHSTFLQ